MKIERKPSDYLETSSYANIFAHAQLLNELNKHFHTLIPDFCVSMCRVANLAQGILIIHASNPAIATRLNQMAPSIVSALQNKGFHCTAIKTRTKPLAQLTSAVRPIAQARPLTVNTRNALNELYQSLSDSTLKTALHHLLTRSQ